MLPTTIISSNDIDYSLYEGVAGNKTSDICFIMLDAYDTPTRFVGFMFGYNSGLTIDELLSVISDFEIRNPDIVNDIKTGAVKPLRII